MDETEYRESRLCRLLGNPVVYQLVVLLNNGGRYELTKALAQAKANAAVTENDQWPVIVAIVLVFGFIFRFAVGGMQEPEPLTAPYADAARAKIYQSDHAASQKLTSQRRGSNKVVPPIIASHQPAKPVANDESLPPAEAEAARLRADVIQKMRERRAAAAKALALHESERDRIAEEYERLRDLYHQGQITQIELLQTEQVLAEASVRVEDDKQWLRDTDIAIGKFNR
jgi:hypothetical protein